MGRAKGSEFVVRLPVVTSADQPHESRGDAERPSRPPRRVLVVDDNRDGVDSLSGDAGNHGQRDADGL